MSRKDLILKLALEDKENNGECDESKITSKEKSTANLPLQEITQPRTRTSSSSSSSSDSSSSSSSSSSTSSSSTSSSLPKKGDVNTAHVTQNAASYVEHIENPQQPRQESFSDGESVISNSPTPGSVVDRRHDINTQMLRPASLLNNNRILPAESDDSRGDFSPDDDDSDYNPLPTTHRTVEESSDTSENEIAIEEEPPTKKRRKGVVNSKKLEAKILRNSGKQYTSVSKNNKVISERKMKPPCGRTCRLKCPENINQEERKILFEGYWDMADLTRQRDYIGRSVTVIKPKYQYKKLTNNRKAKHAFYFTVNSDKIRVCKTFYINTLGINDRPIRTVIEKLSANGIVEEEKRGKHGKQLKVSDDVIQGIKDHIDSIPRIESHYLRQQTTREYIDGGKSLADLFRDYKEKCDLEGTTAAQEHTYRRVFTQNYNISFFVPKKDLCELCSIYTNMDETERASMERKYLEHHEEKRLSRLEKEEDKSKVGSNYVVACYDLQAVLPLPNCKTSAFYYKSKLNVCDFTICDLARDYCECYVWSEVDGLRGANEIGTCVLSYLKNKSETIDDDDLQMVFYSDNCCGQQKNQFMFSMYLYALCNFKIKTITHKFLITGHTQNENDNVHSVIEKAVKKFLKSSPMYVPDQYITLIKTARKTGNPYNVKEMSYWDFYDLKHLAKECGSQFNKNKNGDTVRLTDIKVIQFEKESDGTGRVYYKTSYTQDDFMELSNERTSRTRQHRNRANFELKQLYDAKIELGARKKADLKSLVDSNLIPRYYANSFYNGIL